MVNWALLFLVTVTSVALSLVSQSPFALLLAVLLVLVLLFPAVLFLVGFGSVLPLLCAFSVDQEDAQEQNQEPKGDYKEEAHVKATHTVLDTRLFVWLFVREGGRRTHNACSLSSAPSLTSDGLKLPNFPASTASPCCCSPTVALDFCASFFCFSCCVPPLPANAANILAVSLSLSNTQQQQQHSATATATTTLSNNNRNFLFLLLVLVLVLPFS